MKTAIITYHRAENFGSALQAYALSKVIQKMGNDPVIIDYHSSAQDALYKIFERPNGFLSYARNIHALLFLHQLKQRKEGFARFRNSCLPLSSSDFNETSDLFGLNDEYDLFVCGSDQIWNTQCADFTKAYLLDFVREKSKCVSYAASIGRDKIDEQNKQMFYDLLHEYHCISVREDAAAKELEQIIRRETEVVPDPVLLLNTTEWDELAPERLIHRDYILCYFIGDVPQMRQYAKLLHKKTGLPLVLLSINLRDVVLPGQRRYGTNPAEFVSLVKHAKYICTNSFHAVLFSVMYKKDFWVFTSLAEGTAKSRIDEITERLKLGNRVLNEETGFPADLLERVDYSFTEQALNDYVEHGKNFLKKALGGVK